MAETTTTGKANETVFSIPKPLSIRIWHWCTAIFFISTVLMVLLASTLFAIKDNIPNVQDQVQQKGGTVTVVQARQVAHMYSDKLWMTHKYLGIGLSLLLLFRFIAEMALPRDRSIRKRLVFVDSPAVVQGEARHYQVVQYSYVVFYVIFSMMAMTGLVLAFEDIKWLEPFHKAAKSIHSVLQWALYTYAVFHIAGVLRADLTLYPGIVSRMIHGRKTSA